MSLDEHPDWITSIEEDLPEETYSYVVKDDIEDLIDLTIELDEGEEYTQGELLEEFEPSVVHHLTHQPRLNYDPSEERILTTDQQLLSTILDQNRVMQSKERTLGFWIPLLGASLTAGAYSFSKLVKTGDPLYVGTGSVSAGVAYYSVDKIVDTLFYRHVFEDNMEEHLLKEHSHRDHYTLDLVDREELEAFYREETGSSSATATL